MGRQELALKAGYRLLAALEKSGLRPNDCYDVGLIPNNMSFGNYMQERLALRKSFQPEIWRETRECCPALEQIVPEPELSPFWLSDKQELQMRAKIIKQELGKPAVFRVPEEPIRRWAYDLIDLWALEQSVLGIGRNPEGYKDLFDKTGSFSFYFAVPSEQNGGDPYPLVLEVATPDKDVQGYPVIESLAVTNTDSINELVAEMFNTKTPEVGNFYIEQRVAARQMNLWHGVEEDMKAATELKREYIGEWAQYANVLVLTSFVDKLLNFTRTQGGVSYLLFREGNHLESTTTAYTIQSIGDRIEFSWKVIGGEDVHRAGVVFKSIDGQRNAIYYGTTEADREALLRNLLQLEAFDERMLFDCRVDGVMSRPEVKQFESLLSQACSISLSEMLDGYRRFPNQKTDRWLDLNLFAPSGRVPLEVTYDPSGKVLKG